ncbi:MAG TPA: hypothetical protein P5121_18225 [Caldilineaceae bacterium]|nr:hypothetical protein [Caldilineaceae bacterium]HRW07049.1 hypothetical protein [Caldilineaceae bacterium]
MMVLLLVGVALTILVEPLLATVGLSSSIVPISFGMLEMTLSNVTTLTAAPWLATNLVPPAVLFSLLLLIADQWLRV